jgi:iron complex outermembrane receptor protein
MKTKFIPAFAVLPLSIAVSLAFAETQRIEEVIVTAEKKAENLQSVSSSIAAYSGDRLQQAGIKDLQDLSSISPGLNVQTSGGGESTAIRLRGLGAQRFDQSVPQFVGVFVDEITQHRPGAAMSGLTDIERVEVLRGPQNVLYGKNVPAGAISIVTKKPIMNSLSGDGSVGFGDNDYRDTRLNLNLPIIQDILAARIAAYTTHRTGESEIEPADQTWGGYNQSGGRLHVLFEPSDRWSALATFSTFEATSADFQQPSSVRYVVTDPTALLNQGPQLPGEIIPGVIRGSDLTALDNAYYRTHFGSASVEQIDPFKGSGYRDQKFAGRTRLNSGNVGITHSLTDYDEIAYLAGYQEYATGNFIDGDSTDIHFSSVDSDLKTRYWSHELRWTHSADNFETMAGFFLDQETHRSYTTVYFPAAAIAYSLPADLATSVADDTKRDLDSKSVFGRVAYDLADDWKLVVGARYSETDVSIVLPSYNNLPKSKNFHALVGEATLSYQWSPDILSYLKIANGNQSGGINMAVLTNTALQNLGAEDSFDPAKSKYAELGIKTSLFDSSVQINADVYYQMYDGYQALVAIDSTNTYIANAGRRSRGRMAD